MKAVILAGGKGTRMLPLTHTRPKVLLPLAGKPIIRHMVDDLVSLAGEGIDIDEIVIVANYLEEKIKDFFSAQDCGVKITFMHQPETKGTGDALRAAGRIGEPFFAINGDETFDRGTFVNLARAFKEKAALAVIGVAEVEKPQLYGVLEVDGEGRLLRLLEKPSEPPCNLVNAGVYMFAPDIFDYIERLQPSARGEYELTDAIIAMRDETQLVYCAPAEGWKSVSVPWDLLDANAAKLAGLAKKEDKNVIIGKNVELKPGVHIEGNVFIGDGSVIGPNCYIRGDTSIGRNCRIGNGVEIKNSIIMDDSNVPH
ncbi:MAG: bifunctional sugar-1-phosphate nucleotidylyltransferase/acetyltransferase, partial [Candidatus Aenigmatarchaeota archaeon]